MSITIETQPAAPYPELGDKGSFAPGEPCPELAPHPVGEGPNASHALLRRVFEHHGLDAARFGQPDWNPLGDLVKPGSRVFVLCNFVYHRRPVESPRDFFAKCIHGSVLQALIDYLLLAVGAEGRVAFGNSPLQSCDFGRVLRDAGADRVEAHYRSRGLPVESRDLRLFVTERDALGRVHAVERRDESLGVEIDLGERSLLAQVSGQRGGRPVFRVSDYDPRRIQAFHADGQHRYVIHREILDADVIVSLSKLKTHEKVGITCGLKGFVGSVGHKDCLAHHRFGNPSVGGDEYPDRNAFLRPVSHLHDWVNQRPHGAPLQKLAEVFDRNLRRAARLSGATTTGAWWGNDTCWRMTLDLARIVHYANQAGEMQDTPARRHLSLIDGIVAGEGDGPLNPSAVDAGVLIFGDDVPATDRVACRLMGFDPARIPLIREAFGGERWRLSELPFETAASCSVDGQRRSELELRPILGRPFQPSRGWAQRLAP